MIWIARRMPYIVLSLFRIKMMHVRNIILVICVSTYKYLNLFNYVNNKYYLLDYNIA